MAMRAALIALTDASICAIPPTGSQVKPKRAPLSAAVSNVEKQMAKKLLALNANWFKTSVRQATVG